MRRRGATRAGPAVAALVAATLLHAAASCSGGTPFLDRPGHSHPPAAEAAASPIAAGPSPPASTPAVATSEGVPQQEAAWGELRLAGWHPALVFVPPGPRDARFPLAVVMHGAGGHPAPHCEHWRRLLAERAYVLCPRGTPWGYVPEGVDADGYFFRDHDALAEELTAALGAARAALSPRLDPEGALFVGFSQGATMGALALQKMARDPASQGTFGRIALVEGGTGQWNVPLSRLLAERGVKRVMMVCGQRSCSRDAERSEGWIRRGGLEVRFEDAPGAGHTWGGAVEQRVVAGLPWLLEGDARFAAAAPAPP